MFLSFSKKEYMYIGGVEDEKNLSHYRWFR